MVDKKKQGKKNRASGAAFERRVRKDLEDGGWIVDKWSNNVKLQEDNAIDVSGRIGGPFGKLIPAKHKFRGPGIPMAIGTGFPDFIAFNWNVDIGTGITFGDIIGVECKINGYLDKIEREKCRWLLNNYVFSKIIIAEKTKVNNKIIIDYCDFKEKYKWKTSE